jgi:hypothetical protein
MAVEVVLVAEQLTSESSPELVEQPEAVTAEATPKTATQERQTPVAAAVVQATTETSGLVEQAAQVLFVFATPAHSNLPVERSQLLAVTPFTPSLRAARLIPVLRSTICLSQAVVKVAAVTVAAVVVVPVVSLKPAA